MQYQSKQSPQVTAKYAINCLQSLCGQCHSIRTHNELDVANYPHSSFRPLLSLVIFIQLKLGNPLIKQIINTFLFIDLTNYLRFPRVKGSLVRLALMIILLT